MATTTTTTTTTTAQDKAPDLTAEERIAVELDPRAIAVEMLYTQEPAPIIRDDLDYGQRTVLIAQASAEYRTHTVETSFAFFGASGVEIITTSTTTGPKSITLTNETLQKLFAAYVAHQTDVRQHLAERSLKGADDDLPF